MSLYGMMRTGVSGMAAQANRLATIADNIANVGTNGYKRSSVEFQTQILASTNGTYNSGGVNSAIRTSISQQGSLRSTTSATDLAIVGRGFFIVEDAAGAPSLTRAGSFQVDASGSLVNAAGNYLLGYDLGNTGSAPVANGFAGLSRINVGLQALQAVATTQGNLSVNLPYSAATTASGSLPSDNTAASEYAGKSSLVAFDALGNEVTVDVYFAKTAADTWEVSVFDRAASTNGTFPYTGGALTTGSLSFNPSTGELTSTSQFPLTLPSGDGITLDLAGTTQLGAGYIVNSATTDGSAPTALERVEIDSDGIVYGIYQNSYAEPLFQLALAAVPSPDKLRPLSGNTYSVTVDSGDVVVGTPQSEGFGMVESGALEESNVDMASELTIMIESQRSYTANSKVLQTGSELMDVLINIKR